MKFKSSIFIVIVVSLLLPFLLSCKKDVIKTSPTVSILAVTNVTYMSANCSVKISSSGGESITERGVCWSENPNPTTSDFRTTNGTGTEDFISFLAGLKTATTYNIRAYATNSLGTGYSSKSTLTTSAYTPVISSTEVKEITTSTATIESYVSNDGGASITALGICWSTSQNPTVSNNKSVDGINIGIFVSKLIGLIPNTIYYLRTYATNKYGTSYGNEVTFKTYNPISTETVTDIDGNVYHTVKIGTQVWMVENLKVTRDRNGKSIPTTIPATLGITMNGLANYYQWAYDGKESNVATYGRLYTWYTVNDLEICPAGWHIPTDAEWSILTTYLGGENVAGSKLNESGFSHWISSYNKVATNESGFTALPGGSRALDGKFYSIGTYGYYWSADGMFSANPIYRMFTDNGIVRRGELGGLNGLSVRCLRN